MEKGAHIGAPLQSMRSLVLDSPAKLNLALRILSKRRDGYHELVTLFHRISLRDTLRLQKRKEGIHLICNHPRVPKGRQNLMVRAFDLLKKKYPFEGGVAVRLTKRIPIGGGLGGGSSNAAHFLIGMNRLFKLRLSRKQLMGLGAELGSDVPFFVSGASHAIGRGRGESIQLLRLPRRLWFLLFQSPRGLSTREVYSSFRPPPRLPSLTRLLREIKMTSASFEKGNLEQATRLLVNDLTGSAERIRPSLKKTRERLSGLHLGICRMSGSGPTLYLTFSSQRAALRALRAIRKERSLPSVILVHSK